MTGIGPSFTRPVTLRQEATKFPLTWWQSYGRVGMPALSRMALRVLSQVIVLNAHYRFVLLLAFRISII